MDFKFGEIYKAEDINNYAINLHFAPWDNLGIEESDIPKRINKFKNFKLAEISIASIEEPYFYIDEDLVKEYSKIDTIMPPIILGNKYKGKYTIIDGCHRLKATCKKNSNTILALIPIKNVRCD